MNEEYEEIIHPDHYTWIKNIECSDVIRNFNFNLGAVIKHIWRAGRKPDQAMLKDLYKARQYLQMEIEYWETQEIDHWGKQK